MCVMVDQLEALAVTTRLNDMVYLIFWQKENDLNFLQMEDCLVCNFFWQCILLFREIGPLATKTNSCLFTFSFKV